ncbi:uncharacterized protein LOC112328773 isoform X1 [Populus trichocarpa]|uniref:uncharacterized protein LOC112328773 isoform X1 n=1 Tax=Populus trichocarpa TaxID=3694 RepID=UPI000D189E1C|nr:uncharacterized protein LOC112328773 isoform X1 [Populus trichocarpa]|eukprot:XP_024465109.1 uncharacterized protein LOC112328773 isoform X1 [Populus trichocarpa]
MISMLIYGGAFPLLSIPSRSHFSIHRLNYIRCKIQVYFSLHQGRIHTAGNILTHSCGIIACELGESSINDEGYSCSGSESEEECLIRRSMADHTDYIYTQDISGP